MKKNGSIISTKQSEVLLRAYIIRSWKCWRKSFLGGFLRLKIGPVFWCFKIFLLLQSIAMVNNFIILMEKDQWLLEISWVFLKKGFLRYQLHVILLLLLFWRILVKSGIWICIIRMHFLKWRMVKGANRLAV